MKRETKSSILLDSSAAYPHPTHHMYTLDKLFRLRVLAHPSLCHDRTRLLSGSITPLTAQCHQHTDPRIHHGAPSLVRHGASSLVPGRVPCHLTGAASAAGRVGVNAERPNAS